MSEMSEESLLSRLVGQPLRACLRRWRKESLHRRIARGVARGVVLCGVSIPVHSMSQGAYTVFPVMTAQPVHRGGAPRVSLAVTDSTISYVIQEIARQGKLRAIYNQSDAVLDRRITVRVVNQGVLAAMAVVLKGTGLEARMTPDGEAVMIGAVAERPTRMQGGVVAGRVTDSTSGAGLGGAQVRVEGTKISTVSSDSGNFTLRNVPAGDQVLLARLFGYRPATRTVTVVDSERTTVRIVMTPVPTVLNGVVTTAAGLQRRVEVGNDITVLNADSIQQIAPVSNITQMLETRVPGLVVQHTSGIPGAPSRLRLRGLSSINMSGDPILIVDGVRVYADQSTSLQPNFSGNNGSQGGGVTTGGGSNVGGQTGGSQFAGPSTLDQIDPNSIETIEILKGPAATAIYGSDAANGVIVVTTKHGRPGPTHWTVALDQGRTTLPGSWPTNYFRFGHSLSWWTADQSSLCQNFQFGCVTDSVVAFQALNNRRYSPLTGRPGQNSDATLTISGGSGTLTYVVTGSASTQSGYLHLPPIELTRFQLFHGFPAPEWMRTPDQYTTYGATSRLNVQLGQMGSTLALTSSLFRSAQQQSSLQGDLATLATLYVDTTQLAAQPLFPDYYTRAQLKTTTFSNAASLNNWVPWRWLPLMATAGINVQSQDNNTLLPRDYITCLDSPNDPSGGGCASDSLGMFSISQGTNTSGSLTIGTTLAQQRLVSTALGLNVFTLAQSGYSAYTVGLPIGVSVPTSFTYQNGNGPSYSTVSQATYGWYVQPTLNFHSRFFVSPGFRLDGGSNAGSHSGVNNGALSLFPKLDFSWLAVERSPSEPLFGALTLLRPRVAFGIAGVQPGPGQRLRLLQPGQVIPLTSGGNTTPVDMLQVQTLGNTQLHPERDREVEGGFDAQFWNQRLSLTLTGYHKMAYDAILAIPVAASVQPGPQATSIARNIGTIRNTGTEATIFARLLDSRAVDWSVNANISKNRNLLVSLAPGMQPLTLQAGSVGYSGADPYTTRLIPGYPLFGLWARPILGFVDANHNGVIEPTEVVVGDSAVFVGTQQPNYELTLSTTLAFFNDRLTVNTSVDYQNGLTQAGGNKYDPNLASNNPTLTAAEQAALSGALTQEGVISVNPQTAIGLLQTVNLLRWNTFSMTYLAPPSLAHLVHVPTLSLALQGSNLALHTNYRGVDPNVNAFTSGNLTQDTGGLLPQPRVWNLRVTLGY